METKVCTKCKRELEVDRFSKCKKVKSGLKAECKECAKEYVKKNKERLTCQTPQTKICSKCKRDLDAEKFCKDKGNISGLRSSCRECDKAYKESIKLKRSEYSKQYYKKNREAAINYAKKYRQDNKEKYLECARKSAKKHREENRERYLEKAKISRIKYKEYHKEYHRNYYQDNKVRLSAENKKWALNNKEIVQKYRERWKTDNLEKDLEIHRNYQRNIRDELNDTYIKFLLVRHDNLLKVKDIPQTLVDLKRVQVQITRKLREIK